MKKIVLVLLLLTLCLIVFACTNDKTPERATDENPMRAAMTDADGNLIDLSKIYHFDVSFAGAYKFNVLTGSYTPICPDPLCEDHHLRSDCVFSGIMAVTAQGEWLYFAAYTHDTIFEDDDTPISIHTGSIRAYNYLTREFRMLYSVSDDVFNNAAFQRLFHYRDGYLYFLKRAFDPETEDYTLWSLTRINADTGRAEVIADATPGVYRNGIGDEIVFEDMLSVRGEAAIYKTDMSYQNRVDLITVQGLASVYNSFTYENYIYFHHYVTGENGRRKDALSRIDIETGETSKVAEFPSEPLPLIIGDWIYFGLEHDRSEGRIYRVSAMGGEPEIYYEIPDFRILFVNNVGKYIVAISQHDGERDYRVIDTETGELVVY
jgi:hypothetical protein